MSCSCRVQRPAAKNVSLTCMQATSPARCVELTDVRPGTPPTTAAGCTCSNTSSPLLRLTMRPPGAAVAARARTPLDGGAHHASGASASRDAALTPPRVTCSTTPRASQQKRVCSSHTKPGAARSASSAPSLLRASPVRASTRVLPTKLKTRAARRQFPSAGTPATPPIDHIPSTPSNPAREPTSLTPMPMRTNLSAPVRPQPLQVTT
mmetsp:Transcript_137905/g.257278  ORF Transcript_137905/g.257278 Transcript_137905/m.257278 type:complete len:208 (+) Transcript_137905:1676-2299(+)